MPQYLSPGVYVEEVPSAIKAIASVSTSTAAFIGIVPNKIQLVARNPAFDPSAPPPVAPAVAPKATKFVEFTLLAEAKAAVLVTSWAQFTRQFGDLMGDESVDAIPGTGTIDEGHRQLAHAVYGFFNNGGSRAYVVRVLTLTDMDAALQALAGIDEVAIVAAPGITDDAIRDKLVTHCQKCGDRFAILDGPPKADLTLLTVTAAEQPAKPATTTPPAPAVEAGKMPKKTDFAAWYYPWITVFDPATKLGAPSGPGALQVPPSGHIAGIYARVDTERGVFKAPANEAIRGALGVTHLLSKAEQDGLNPRGVNCIRVLNGNIFLWGARTIGGDGNADLKYIPVRRTLLFLRESIDEGTQWAVFEPNTPELWAKIARNVTAFLTNVWRSGALFGNTQQEAFYVKCDAETNPPSLRELGQVVTEIGVAIVRPAEFVIFRVSQFSPPSK